MALTNDTPIGTPVRSAWTEDGARGTTVTPVDPDQRMVKVDWPDTQRWEYVEDLRQI
jgi:hypothetical protein